MGICATPAELHLQCCVYVVSPEVQHGQLDRQLHIGHVLLFVA